MTTSELIKAIRENFAQRISQKTGWGKNEIITELDKAFLEEAMKELNVVIKWPNTGRDARREGGNDNG